MEKQRGTRMTLAARCVTRRQARQLRTPAGPWTHARSATWAALAELQLQGIMNLARSTTSPEVAPVQCRAACLAKSAGWQPQTTEAKRQATSGGPSLVHMRSQGVYKRLGVRVAPTAALVVPVKRQRQGGSWVHVQTSDTRPL